MKKIKHSETKEDTRKTMKEENETRKAVKLRIKGGMLGRK
jgi:hypothetical protein